MKRDFLRVLLLPTVLALLAGAPLACGGGGDGEDVTGPGEQPGNVRPEGGRVELGQGVVLDVPAGAVSQPIQATLTVRDTDSRVRSADTLAQGKIYDIGPNGTHFAVPVAVTLPWPGGFQGAAEDLLPLTLDAGGKPELLGDVTRQAGTSVQGTTTHLTPFWVSALGGMPGSVDITPAATSVVAGDSVALTASVRSLGGRDLADAEVTWMSLDDTLASVSAAGWVTGRRTGSARIVATAGSAADTASVEVVAGAAAVLRVAPAADTLGVGDTLTIRARVSDALGNEVSTAVTWSTTDAAVAGVDSGGVVTGVGAGSGAIVATRGALADTAEVGVAGPGTLLSTAFPAGGAEVALAPGDTVQVPVTLHMGRVSGDGDLGAVRLELAYDAGVLEVVGTQSGGSGISDVNTDTPGLVGYAFVGTSPQGTPDVTLLTVTFGVKVDASAGAAARLSLSYPEAPASTAFVRYGKPVAVGGRVVVVGG